MTLRIDPLLDHSPYLPPKARKRERHLVALFCLLGLALAAVAWWMAGGAS